MNLEDRLTALAQYHEDAAKSVRTTLALLMHGARETASKALTGKLKTAMALRRNGHGPAHATGEDASPVILRRGKFSHRIAAWLAEQEGPQTSADISRQFPGARGGRSSSSSES